MAPFPNVNPTGNHKVCVILGAGASWDVRGEGSPVDLKSREFLPPMSHELFALEDRPGFRPILAEYKGAVMLAQELARKSSRSDFDIERELRSIKEDGTHLEKEHYKHVPPYLRDLLMKCSYEYTDYPSNYVQLVQGLMKEDRDILFLVLNYDDLLEQALSSWAGVNFRTLDDYVRADQPKVIKLHGSIDWFKVIGTTSTDWNVLVSNSDVTAPVQGGEIKVVRPKGKADRNRTFQIESAGQRVYPVLTAPLADKGTAATVCPADHLDVAREFLNDCDRFLIIGARGVDDDLMDLLRESSMAQWPWVQFVNGSAVEGETVLKRFRDVGLFDLVDLAVGSVAFDGGFRKYLEADGLIKFLEGSGGHD